MIQTRMVLLVGLVFLAALSRLLPHPPNFAPVCAIALFGGAMFARKRWAFIVPALAMLLSDVILYRGTYAAWSEDFLTTSLPNYVAFLMIVFIGLWLRKRRSVANIFATTLSGSVLFFLVSNLGVWLSGWYPMDFAGLVECYWMGIQFYQRNFGSPLLNTILGDAVYATVLFGSYAFAERCLPTLQLQAEHVLTPAD